MNYCSVCGKPVRKRVPPGDHRMRFVCDECNTVHYENPRLIVGCLPIWGESVLLCKRANEPRSGYWTLPAGFLETGETAEEGALRETFEEAHAEAEIVRVWNRLIDPTLSAHAQPTGLNRGTLFVTVDSPVWRDEIVRYRRKEILDRLQHAFGRDLIARISFRLG